MQTTRYSCQILMKLECSRQIFEKYSNIKFHGTSSCWEPSCSMRTDGLRNGHDEAVRNFVNVPEISSRYWHRKLSCTLYDSKNCIQFYLISTRNTADSWSELSCCQAYLMSSCILLLYKMSLVILSNLQFHTAKKKTDECFRGKKLN